MTLETGPKIAPNELRTAEARHFRHILTDNNLVLNPEMTNGERLRLVCDPEAIKSETYRAVFQALFHPPAEADRKRDFEYRSVEPHEATRLSRAQKDLRNDILKHEYGFISTEKKKKQDLEPYSADAPELNVGFTNARDTTTWYLNNLEDTLRMKGIGQTDPIFPGVTRAEHTKHLAYKVTQTVLRMAILQPEEFVDKIREDFRRVGKFAGQEHQFMAMLPRKNGKLAHNHQLSLISRQINSYLDKHHIKGKERKRLHRSLLHAAIVLPYYHLAVYQHDSETPAFGDVVMKTKQRGDKSKGANWSEDEVLGKNIDIKATQNRKSGIPGYLAQFKLNPTFAVSMIRSLATEGDSTLAGYLFKHKRKFDQNEAMRIPFLESWQVYDLDQESGTTSNKAYEALAVMPGGHKFIVTKTVPPHGAFEERAMFFAYCQATGIDKETATKLVESVGLKGKDIWIAAEEYALGHNLALERYPYEVEVPKSKVKKRRVEIIPVAADAGDIKKAMLMFNILQVWSYRSHKRATSEALAQTFLAHALWGESKEFDTQITMDTFAGRPDGYAYTVLATRAPQILHTLEKLSGQAEILTEEEMKTLVFMNNGSLDRHLILHIPGGLPGLIQFKSGTLVHDDLGGPAQRWVEIIRHKLDRTLRTRTRNPQSVPDRLEQAQEVAKRGEYMVITLDDSDIAAFKTYTDPSNNPTAESTRRALEEWIKKIDLGYEKITPRKFW